MENKEEKLVQTNEAFEEYKKAVSKLKDGPFKDFYQKNPDEMQRLFNTVDIKDLNRFNKNIFSLADVWERLYTVSSIKNLNFITEDYYEMVLSSLSKKGNITFKKYNKVVNKLKDGFYIVFCQNDPGKMGYRFNDADVKDFVDCSASIFSLEDIWECLYAASLKKKFDFTTEDFSEMIVSPLLTKVNKSFEEYEKAVSKLKDSPFKDFYQNNSDEMKYLSRKVNIHDLANFAESTFLLEDIWKWLYITLFKKTFKLKTEIFQKMALFFCWTERKKNGNLAKTVKIGKWYVKKTSLIKHIEDDTSTKNFLDFKSFKKTKNKELDEVLEYAFGVENMRNNFKIDGRYILSPIEAMFIFFIFEDKYKENIKRIKHGEERLLNRRLLNGLYRYTVIISKERNLSIKGLEEVYRERKKILQSDLPRIGTLVQETSEEYKKGDDADLDKVIKKSKKCIGKLKKFIKRVEKLKQDTTNISD